MLTNNSRYTPYDPSHNLTRIGLDIPPESIVTSALATAAFIHQQKPDGTAFVIGERGLTSALPDQGYILTEHNPDYVVLGESDTLKFDVLTQAIRLVKNG